jgi:Beta-1,3-glucanase
MFGLTKFAVALAAAVSIVPQALAAPTELHPGDASNLIINAQDTINGTTSAAISAGAAASTTNETLTLTITNNIGSGVNCYVVGSEPSGTTPMILKPDFTWYYPTAPSTASGTPQLITEDIAIPISDSGETTITVPSYVNSARVWFAVGELKFYTVAGSDGSFSVVQPSQSNPDDPSAGINWGFVEFSWLTGSGVYANVSYVDFVGLPLGLSLTNTTGGVQTALGLEADAVTAVCNDLTAQAAVDGYPWDQLCMSINGTVMRVLAPYDYMEANATNGFTDYFSDYVDEVWSNYTDTPLIINTQKVGNVSCTVSGDILGCPGDNVNYTKPSTADIFGCNTGPFVTDTSDTAVHQAAVPRLCAAFNRATLLLDGGNYQPSLPSTDYYTTLPNNYYSKIVHKYEVDGKGYAFSYDDVNPSGLDENASGEVSSTSPKVLAITVGGPTSS